MDKKTFEGAVALYKRISVIEEILARFEQQDKNGGNVTVIFTQDENFTPIVRRFCDALSLLLLEYKNEIKEM